MYAIKSETKWGVSWVRTGIYGDYAGLGKLPTVFGTQAHARAVIAEYKLISRNSGKKPSPLKIVTLGEV